MEVNNKLFLSRLKFFQIWLWVSLWHIMQQWHAKNKRNGEIILDRGFIISLCQEAAFLSMPDFLPQVTMTTTYSNFS